MIVADADRETDRQRGSARNIVEPGARFQLDPLTVVSEGGGAGIGDRSPRYRLLFGIQRSLTFP